MNILCLLLSLEFVSDVSLRQSEDSACYARVRAESVYFERCDRNCCLCIGVLLTVVRHRFQRMYAAPLVMEEYF